MTSENGALQFGDPNQTTASLQSAIPVVAWCHRHDRLRASVSVSPCIWTRLRGLLPQHSLDIREKDPASRSNLIRGHIVCLNWLLLVDSIDAGPRVLPQYRNLLNPLSFEF